MASGRTWRKVLVLRTEVKEREGNMVRLAGGETGVDCGCLEDMLSIWGHPGLTGRDCTLLFLKQGLL